MIPKHYSLAKEHPHSYEIHDDRDGKRFHVAKNGLNLAMHGELSKIKKYAEGTPDVPVQAESVPMGPMNTNVSPSNGVSAETAIAPTESVPSPQPTASTFINAPGVYPTTPVSQPQQAPEIQSMQTNAFNQNAALEEEKKAIEAGSQAESEQGLKSAAAYEKEAQDLENNTADFRENYAIRQKANDELQKAYLDKTINPDQYLSNKGTASKISAGIGMILGGIGAGMTGGPNYAFESIQKAIERDIDAQKNDQSKGFNLWKMNREAMQDDQAAHLAMQNQMLLGVKAKTMQYAAESAGPLAKARAAQLIEQIQSQVNMNTLSQSLLGASQGGKKLDVDPARLLPMIPQDKQAEAAKEIAQHQQLKALHDDIVENAERLKSKFMNGVLSPNDRKALIDPLASRLDTITDHRFNLEASKQKIESMMPEPTDFGKETSKDKARAREYFFKDQMQAPVFKGFAKVGLDRFKSTSLDEPKAAPDSTESYRQYVQQNLNSRDPKIQQRVNFIRSKYNF